MDERGMFYNMAPARTVVTQRPLSCKNATERMAGFPCFNSDGTFKNSLIRIDTALKLRAFRMEANMV